MQRVATRRDEIYNYFHGSTLTLPLKNVFQGQGHAVALNCCMPELSRFLGIVIAMYYRDHNPAHFHAIYGEAEITVEVATGKVNGDFPPRALAHVLEWKDLHRDELLEAWSLARSKHPLPHIQPLE